MGDGLRDRPVHAGDRPRPVQLGGRAEKRPAPAGRPQQLAAVHHGNLPYAAADRKPTTRRGCALDRVATRAALRLRVARWELALVAVTAIWGWTFVLVRDAVADVPPFAFIAWRFLAAALLLAAVRPAAVARRDPGLLAAGVVTGFALFAGYGFQTVGLQYTSASNAGFITGLAVVLTPLLGALVLREAPGRWPAAGAALAAVGLGLLSLQRLELRRGDALVLGCAVAFAAHILLLGRNAPRHRSYALAVVQLATAGVLALVWAGAAGDLVAPQTGTTWVALAVTAVAASAGAFLVQTRAQREVPPTRTAVILTMEPVFAGVFGFLLAGERLTARGWLGAGCILGGMLVAELGRAAGTPGRAEEAFE
ncbi:MAG TPA: DMT family transporter [Actinomycetes bacterium]|nr:DMT family transporter [Actinomycetes bacterium]